jgi:protein TonB
MPAAVVEAAPRARPVHEVAPVATPAPAVGAAQDASPAPVIANVTWAQQPMPNYPAEAARNGIQDGTVVLSCHSDPDGRPTGCSVVSETPAGAGFGAEALAAMQTARFSPRSIQGAAPGATVRFTVRFRVAD